MTLPSGTAPVPALDGDSGLRWTDAAPEQLRTRSDLRFLDATDGVVVQDQDAHIVASNDLAAETLRLTWDTVFGLTSLDPRWAAFDEHGDPFPGEGHPAMVGLRTGADVLDTVMGVDAPGGADGGVFVWLSVSAFPFRGDDGQVAGVVVRFRDISHEPSGRRAAQRVIHRLRRVVQEASDAERRFRFLAENSADIVLQVDGEGQVAWVSPSVQEVLGWRPEQVVGGDVRRLVHPDDLARLEPDAGDELPYPVSARRRVELRFATTAGGWRWMSAQTKAVQDADGRVTGGVTALRDVQTEVENREELQYLAAHDGLTGLMNRESAMRALAQLIERCRGTDRVVGVLYLDVDRFKEVNDEHGHQAGDRLLIDVGRRLTATLRETDVVARLGGDEFLVVLPSQRGEAFIQRRAESLCRMASQGRVPGVPHATVSIGMALDDGSGTPEDALARADAALYRAKQAGRDHACW